MSKIFLKMVSLIVAVSFLWTNCVWASGELFAMRSTLDADKLAAQTQIPGLTQHPAGVRFAADEAILKGLGINSLGDIVRNMEALTEAGVKCLVSRDSDGKIAKYIIRDGAILRKTGKGEKANDLFYRVLELLGKESRIDDTGGENRELIGITEENDRFINSILALLSGNNPEWVVKQIPLEQPLEGSHDAISEIVRKDLQYIRRYFHEEKYVDARPMVEKLISRIKGALLSGATIKEELLSYYYTANVMLKVIKAHQFMFLGGSGKNSLQVLVLDSKREMVLLQKRGHFKRLFAGKYTISANAKPKSDELPIAAATKAVESEIGINVDPSRFQQVGDINGYQNYLISYDFYAFTAEEERKLRTIYENIKIKHFSTDGVVIDYNEQKRSLCVFTVNPSCTRDAVIAVANHIEEQTGIPYIYPVFDDDRNSLFVYQLSEEEEGKVNEKIEYKRNQKARALKDLENIANVSILKTIDSDDMEFVHWTSIRNDFADCALNYALDLSGQYFGNDDIWNSIFPQIVDVDSPIARHINVAGGKGSNMHILRQLSRTDESIRIPEAGVITSFVYEKLVLGNDSIRQDIDILQSPTPGQDIKTVSARIRDKILQIELPDGLKDMVRGEFKRLGRDIAVRSSATAEDLKEHAAAGQADSFLHITNENEVFECIKKVWASLFSDGFITDRSQNGISHLEAKMPVLLQKFVNPKAAGVATSIHPATGRPVYNISAQPGIGEGVVQGKGIPDVWLVGLMGDVVLEKHIAVKTRKFVQNEEGGTREEDIDDKEPSLGDGEVLKVGQIVRKIHQYYKSNRLAQNVDVEFVVDKLGNVYIVQARAENLKQEIRKGDKSVFKIKVVDEEKISEGIKVIQLDTASLVACPGAVTAELQVIRGGGSKDAKSGVILVTHHTNNEWNDAFAKLAGVITVDGGDTSHAAKNSRIIGIPCLVGSSGVIDLLEKFDGQTVTLDSSTRRIYLGPVSIKEEERDLTLWIADPDELGEVLKNKDVHELFREWHDNIKRRPEVFKQDFEGHWRGRSGIYGYFQLDYYYKAWDYLTSFLNKRFESRRPWALYPQERAIKNKRLFHKIIDNDPKSIFYFLAGLRGVDIADFIALFEERWRGFHKYSEFMQLVDSINASNVNAVIDELIEVFSWMHFAYWLNVCVDTLFVFDQLKYIRKEFHDTLKDVAIQDLPASRKIDLSRNKDKEIYAVLEQIRSDSIALEIFNNYDILGIERELKIRFPDIFAVINGWSLKYKKGKEHLDVLSDTGEYLKDIQDRLKQGSFMDISLVALYYQEFIDREKAKASIDIDYIHKNDNNLYLVIKGYARLLVAQSVNVDWDKLSKVEKGHAIILVTEEDILKFIPDVIKSIEKLLELKNKREKTVKALLSEFPRLKQILALSRQETTLREDGHHLILPHQRKMAQMMLEVAKKYSGIFKKPEDIFDIGINEFIALFQEDNPVYIGLTFQRNALIENIESNLERDWKSNKLGAIEKYEAKIVEVVAILNRQIQTAKNKSVIRYYRNIRSRLLKRVNKLKKLLRLENNLLIANFLQVKGEQVARMGDHLMGIEEVVLLSGEHSLGFKIKKNWEEKMREAGKIGITVSLEKLAEILATRVVVDGVEYFDTDLFPLGHSEEKDWHKAGAISYPLGNGFNFTKLYTEIKPRHLVERVALNNSEWIIGMNNAPNLMYHMLVVPAVARAQLANGDDLSAMQELLDKLGDPNAALLHNSLMGGAGVNSLHFHLYFYDFPIFREGYDMYPGTDKYSSRVFQGSNFISEAGNYLNELQKANQPYSIIMHKGETIVIPRPGDLEFHYGAQELAGAVFSKTEFKKAQILSDENIKKFALYKEKITGDNLSKAREIFKQSVNLIQRTAEELRGKGEKRKVSILFSYFDDPRIFPKSDDIKLGEDSLKIKVLQLKELFDPYSDVLSWELVIVDNTGNKSGGRELPEPEGIVNEVIGKNSLAPGQIKVINVPEGYVTKGYPQKFITKGGSILYGMNELLDGENKPDILIYTDADLTTDLRQVGLLVGPIVLENKQVVVGTRASKDAVALPGLDVIDQLIGKASAILKKDYLLKPLVAVPDTQCGFKAFSHDIMGKIIGQAQDGGWAFDTELLMLVLKEGDEIASSPILWCDSPGASGTSILVRWQMIRDWIAQYERRMDENGFITDDKPTLTNAQIGELKLYVNERLKSYKTDTDEVKMASWVGLLNIVQRWRLENFISLNANGQSADASELRNKIIKDYKDYYQLLSKIDKMDKESLLCELVKYDSGIENIIKQLIKIGPNTVIEDGVDLMTAIKEGRGVLDPKGIFYLITRDAKGNHTKGRRLESGTILYLNSRGELVIDDLFEIINPNTGEIAGEKVPGTDAHNQGKWHRTSNIILLTEKGEMILQERATNKKTFPSYLSIHGGHVTWGSDYEETALDELEQEVRFEDEIVIHWRPEGLQLVNITEYDATANPIDPNAQPNREYRALYVYVLNADEEAKVREIARRLEAHNDALTAAHDTMHEVAGLVFMSFGQFVREVRDFKTALQNLLARGVAKKDLDGEARAQYPNQPKYTPDLAVQIAEDQSTISRIKELVRVQTDLTGVTGKPSNQGGFSTVGAMVAAVILGGVGLLAYIYKSQMWTWVITESIKHWFRYGLIGVGILVGLYFIVWRYVFPVSWYIRRLSNYKNLSEVENELRRYGYVVQSTSEGLIDAIEVVSKIYEVVKDVREGYVFDAQGNSLPEEFEEYKCTGERTFWVGKPLIFYVLNRELVKYALENKRIPLEKLPQQLREFLEFLKQNGLSDIVVMGGAVRDIFYGIEPSDFDIAVKVEIDQREWESIDRSPNFIPRRIYDFSMLELQKFAGVIRVDLKSLQPPVESDPAKFRGRDVQYSGPTEITTQNGKKFIIKGFVVDDMTRRALFPDSSIPSLLQMGIDTDGNLYGYVESLEDILQGKIKIIGNRSIFKMGGILRTLRLKHRYGLKMSDEDYEFIKSSVAKAKENMTVNKYALKEVFAKATEKQYEKVLDTALNRKLAEREMRELGITSFVKALREKMNKQVKEPANRQTGKLDNQKGFSTVGATIMTAVLSGVGLLAYAFRSGIAEWILSRSIGEYIFCGLLGVGLVWLLVVLYFLAWQYVFSVSWYIEAGLSSISELEVTNTIYKLEKMGYVFQDSPNGLINPILVKISLFRDGKEIMETYWNGDHPCGEFPTGTYERVHDEYVKKYMGKPVNESTDKTDNEPTSSPYTQLPKGKEEPIIRMPVDNKGIIGAHEIKGDLAKLAEILGVVEGGAPDVAKAKLQDILNSIAKKYPGMLGVAREIVLVDNLGGLDSDIQNERSSAGRFQNGVIAIDIDAFKNDKVLYDVVLHELRHSILEVVESDKGIEEAAAVWQSLLYFTELSAGEQGEQTELIKFLRRKDNGLDSEGYADLLQMVKAKGLKGDALIPVAISYVLSEPRYAGIRSGLTEGMDGAVKTAIEKLSLAEAIYDGIIKAIDKVPAVGKVRNADTKAKILMKVKMIVSSMPVRQMDLTQRLLDSNKFVELYVDEVKGNEALIAWIKTVLGNKSDSPFVFLSNDGKSDSQDVIQFINDNFSGDARLLNAGKRMEEAKLSAEFKPETNVIRLVSIINANDTNKLSKINLNLPFVCSVTGVYLAAEIVIAGGKFSEIKDKLVQNALESIFNPMFDEPLTEQGWLELFRGIKLPAIEKITGILNELREAIRQTEMAA